jgi:hypothetical protein
MQTEPFVNLFGPLDTLLAEQIASLLLLLVLVNMVTRFLAHRRHVDQYSERGVEAISRWIPHELSNIVLVLASFYFLTVHQHGGMVMSMLVVGLVITDFFEFEGRKVEGRRDLSLDRPKGALTAWVFVLLYAVFQAFLGGPIASYV